jgi:hypothetical protein
LLGHFFIIITPPNQLIVFFSWCLQLKYVFYGLYKLDLRCKSFFDQVQDMLPNYPEFKGETDERLICARDCHEQYVLSRVGEYAFKTTLNTEADNQLLKRMKLLSFLKPEVNLYILFTPFTFASRTEVYSMYILCDVCRHWT